jgi:hypothetical protein
MNRRDRRRARTQGRQTGYMHRVLAAMGNGTMPSMPGVHIVTIEHDPRCSIYRGRGCNCVPDMSVSSPEGVTVIGMDGSGKRVMRS